MAAAAFTGTMIFRGANGRTLQVRTTMNDVAAGAWTFPSGETTLTLPTDTNWSLVDIIVITGGTDTTNSSLFVNQLNSGLVVDHRSNLNTAQFRQFITNPVTFRGGSQLRLTQAA